MPIYNKLVRDKILEIIEEDGKKFSAKELSPEQHIIEIKRKLYEELNEFETAISKDDAIEELADILELIHSILTIYDVNYDILESIRVKKKKKRGGFEKGLYLIEVED